MIPDGTLSTTVYQTEKQFTIINGDRVGNNLFHSFSQFSIPTGGAAIFENAIDIQNIFSRVTGGNISHIDGLIKTNGSANLFLLNPAGILFGPNARLNIGGSFVGTTANSIRFADGVEFSATNPTATPLLTLSVPIGLQMGENPIVFTPSGIGVTSFNLGNTGQLTIDTSRLSVRDGATVSAATQSPGNSGNLMINAASSIEVSGVGSASGQPSKITAGATVLTPTFQQVFKLPPFPTGNTGDLIINTPKLQISNGGIVSVSHEGVGNAGNLLINTNSIDLDRTGSITAATNSGEGGSMNLRTNTLIGRNRSHITTNAGGSGNGGNIAIESPIMVALENSDITANALQGNGGNIQIKTQGFFLSPDSGITASSQLGISGVVSISNPNLEASNLVVIPTNTLSDQAPVIASSCLTGRNTQQGRFVVTGNGGLAETPDNALIPYQAAQVRRLGLLHRRRNRSLETGSSWQPSHPFPEATGFVFTADGRVALAVTRNQVASTEDLTCAVNSSQH